MSRLGEWETMTMMTLRNAQSLATAARPSGCGGKAGYPAPELTRLAVPVHAPRTAQRSPAFTLIELILVMAILVMMVSFTAPTLSHFFRGRTLNSEARRLLALTRSGQSRAVSEGLPMDLWVDAAEGAFGLEAEPSFDTSDSKAVEFTVDGGLKIEVVNRMLVAPAPTMNRSRQASTTGTAST